MCGKRLNPGWLWLVVLLSVCSASSLGAEPIMVERAELEQILGTVTLLEKKLIELETMHESEVKAWETAFAKQETLRQIAEDGWKSSLANAKVAEGRVRLLVMLVGVLTILGGVGWLL